MHRVIMHRVIMHRGIGKFETLITLVSLLACFGLVGVTAWSDLRYLMFSKTVQADLISAKRENGSNDKRISVEYSFTDTDGKVRKESDKLPAHWKEPTGQKIDVAYLPGIPGGSHVSGNWNGYWLFMIGFIGALGLVVGLPIYLSYRAGEKKRAARALRQRARSSGE